MLACSGVGQRGAGARCRGRISAVVLAAALLAVPVAVPDAAVPGGEGSPQERESVANSVAGRLLVAAPSIGDPRFAHSVILMVHHDKGGAFGVIINHPVRERELAALMEAIGEDKSGVTGSVPVYSGGPVQPEVGFVVHSPEYHRTETLDIDGRVAMTASREILRDIAHDKGPHSKLVIFGYAGWAPGQLENEMARGDWFIAADDPHLLFDEDRDKVWDDAMTRRLQDL